MPALFRYSDRIRLPIRGYCKSNLTQFNVSLNLKGVVAQQLVPTPDGKARRAAMEILLGTPLIQDYIRDGEIRLGDLVTAPRVRLELRER